MTKPKECDFTEDRHLKLKYYVENIPFRFHWVLQESDQDLSHLVTTSLFIALKQTKDRETELLNIIEKKDVEIQDLRSRSSETLNSELDEDYSGSCNGNTSPIPFQSS